LHKIIIIVFYIITLYMPLSNNTTTKTSVTQMTPEQTAQSIKNIAKTIREASARMRETVRTLHQSGAIDEITKAVHEATLAARDTAKEIRSRTSKKECKEEESRSRSRTRSINY
jgi:signal transduction histidine kinase